MTPRGGDATSACAEAQLLLIPALETAATASSRADRELKWERKKKVMKIILSCFSVGSISLFSTFSFSISHVQFV